MGTTVDATAAAAAAASAAAAAAVLMALKFSGKVFGITLLIYAGSLESHILGLEQFLQEIVLSCEERLEVIVNN